MMYDVCVVGAGMTGSAAARWVSSREGIKACLVGPAEPTEQEWREGSTRSVFGAHYDEGRIMSAICESIRHETWLVLAQRSISRLRQLEKESGIRFFHQVGCMSYTTPKRLARIQRLGLPATFLNAEGISRFYARFNRPSHDKLPKTDATHVAALERENAGYVNPRKYIAANITVAARNGCDVVTDVVNEVREVCDQCEGGRYMQVVTSGGRGIRARRVLLCTGAFTNFGRLLPPGIEVDITLTTERAVFLEVSDKDVARLVGIPCTVSQFDYAQDHRSFYFFPPMRYPDGKIYIKVGHGSYLNRPLPTYDDVISWYRRREDIPQSEIDFLTARLYGLLTDFTPKYVTAATCVITSTPTDRYYCDMVTPTLGVVVGGNGSGAIVADEVGRMGALMIAKGSWDHDLPAEFFKVKYKDVDPKQTPKSNL
ncbi:monomeric sarcosine oxidase-like [Diadema antillarum]|uniref:monomeric sarcosine oxidase-like n=1 Tax=Diadema antillarum TaxID=105358 RepID=UPI003A8AA8AD